MTVTGAVLVVDPLAHKILWREYDLRGCLVRWSPDGDHLAVRHVSQRPAAARLELWRVPSDQALYRGGVPAPASVIDLGVDHNPSDSLAWHPDGTVIAATSKVKALKLWQPGTDDVAPHEQPVKGLSRVIWSPDGITLAVGTDDDQWFSLDPLRPAASTRACLPQLGGRRDFAQRPQWPEEAGALRRRGSGPPALAEFASHAQTHLLGRSFAPLLVTDANRHRSIVLESDRDQQWYDAAFTPAGDKVVAASADRGYTRTTLTLWPLTGAKRESPLAQWLVRRTAKPYIYHVWRVAVSDTHVALVANNTLVGLFALPDLRPVCWLTTNGTVKDAAFDPSGHRLAVVGDAGLYLFAVHGSQSSGEAT
ncbi:WD40 repeat domain-containing protein [Streptomyces sp. NPDC048442]|uniref:WD40 repeat domain-containing protein n=1 Tax=Streptomyces sp. NPDC048442 TaxID=3154823 RepID=UPI0034385BA3